VHVRVCARMRKRACSEKDGHFIGKREAGEPRRSARVHEWNMEEHPPRARTASVWRARIAQGASRVAWSTKKGIAESQTDSSL
jgi:hypothetical protein